MREFSATLQSHMDARVGLIRDMLVWATGIDKSTDEVENVGFWTGPTDTSFEIAGETRAFHGVGSVITVPALAHEVGLSVRSVRLRLSPIHTDVAAAIQQYTLRLQPIQLYTAYSVGVSGNLVDDPVQAFDGVVAGQPVTGAVIGNQTSMELMLLSAAYHLTRPLRLRKSDAALNERQPGDRMRRYAATSGLVETVWGTERGSAPAGATPPGRGPAGSGGYTSEIGGPNGR